MILYTADLHFGHGNVIQFDHRPFADVAEMDNYMIARWNDRVRDDDDVYILGDFCYKSGRKPQDYIWRLNGHKHLIVGNHDGSLLKQEYPLSLFESVDSLKTIVDQGKMVVLCHYPLAEWPGYFRGAYHVYGHIHNNRTNRAYKVMSCEERALNAGCMINGYAPVSLRELVENNRRF